MSLIVVEIFFPIWLVAILFSIGYCYRYRNDRFFRVRSIPVMFFSTFFGFGSSLYFAISLSVGTGNCFVEGIFYSLLFPLAFSPMVLMVPDLMIRHQLNEEKSNRAIGKVSTVWRLRPFLYLSNKFLMMFFLSVIQMGIYFLFYFLGSFDCSTLSLFIFDTVMMLAFIPFAFVIRRISNITDPFQIKNQLLIIWIIASPLIVITVLYPFAPQIFPSAFDFRMIFITSNALMFSWNFLAIISYHHFRPRNQNVLISSVSSYFGFGHQSQFQEILAFCRERWCSENIYAYEAILNFEIYHTLEGARRIFDNYIDFDAPLQINLNYQTVIDLKQKLEQQDISSTLFDPVKIELEVLLEGIIRDFQHWDR